MEPENPFCLEEKEMVTFPPSKIIDDGEYLNFEHKILNKSNDKTSNKRRLIITTTSSDPVLIEFRPNLPKPLIDSLVSNSNHCDIVERECSCNILCSEHMKLWNELHQLVHNPNACKLSKGCLFEKEIQDSFFNETQKTNCRELWSDICGDALQTIQQLKRELEKEKDEREKYALALTKFSDLEEQLEMEKNMRSQECKNYDVVILDMQSQIEKQAEEIRRLQTKNHAIERDGVLNIKSIKNKGQEDVRETKQRILELECQLAEESKQHKLIYINQESKCNHLQLKIDELEIKQNVMLHECDNLKLKIEELEKENLQYQEEVMLSTFRKDGDDKILNYSKLQKDYDTLKEELEKLNNNYTRTSNKLRHNVSKRRRLEAESEGEKQQRLNLAAALYELENEIEANISIINSLQSTTCESIFSLTSDLENFQMELEKSADSNDSKLKSLICHNNDLTKPIENNEQNLNKKIEIMDSNMDIYKGIPNTKTIVLKLTHESKKLSDGISNVKVSMGQVLKTQKSQARTMRKEVAIKLESIEAEKETLCQQSKVLGEENKSLGEENKKLRHEVSTLKFEKSKFSMEIKDLDKEIEDLQENAKNLREENRKLLKEAKWKSVGKHGGYQESLIVQGWEKKLKNLEVEYEVLRHVKKDLVKDKRRLVDELNKTKEKGYKGLVGSDDQKLKNELHNMTQERNKLRKIKITLAIENVSLKESIAELNRKVDALQSGCESLQEWKEKVQKLEKDSEDLQNWKNKAETLEIECKELRDNQMKVEGHEIECKCKKKTTLNKHEQECKLTNEVDGKEYKDIRNDENSLEEECKTLRECKLDLTTQCQKLQEKIDIFDRECNILREFKENIEKTNEFNGCNANKVQVECKRLNDNGDKLDVEEKGTNLDNSNSMMVVENCNIQELLETIANLKDENVKLCENHQVALDNQWNVLQVDLKAFEGKIEELESECESIRRDHLSSMVENLELARDKDKLLTMYNEQKYNYEILETAHECLQKNYEQKQAQQVKERNDFHASIDNLRRQVLELESNFCERLHQQATNYASCLQLKNIINGLDTVTLTRQEYEILLAEKAIMVQERDNTHKKLCNVEVQNIQLSASIECLQQELSCSKQDHDEKEIGAEVLLAQDVVNLRSMLNSLEEELKNANFEKNKIVDANMSLKKELNDFHEVLSHREYENQILNDTFEELRKKSSLEQIHSAASSLKEQLGKVSKEKDSIKEQFNKVIKEKEQLAKVANERDNVIFLLKDEIKKLEKEREESLKIQLQQMGDDTMVKSFKHDDLKTIVMERDNLEKELAIVQGKLESLYSKMLDVEDDQTKKLKLRQDKYEIFEEKCKKIEIELHSTKEALTMTKEMKQKDIEKAIKEKHDFELMANKETESVRDELAHIEQSLNEKLDNASKELNNIVEENNKVVEEFAKCKEELVLMQKENEELKTLVKEKDKVISTKYELVNEQDHLLAMVANLKTEKELMKKNFEQDLHEEMSSIKALLDTTIKEKEKLVRGKEYLEKTIDDLHVTLREQLLLISAQKDQLVYDKENAINERNELLHRISSFTKNEETKPKKNDLDLNGRSNGNLEFCENILNIQGIQNNPIEHDAKEIELNEIKIRYNILNDENSILSQEKERLFKEHNNLLEELSVLKKNNEIKLGKKGKRQWNFKGYKEEIKILIHEKEQLLTSQESLKQQIVDLKEKCTKLNSSFNNEKMTLLENHVVEITLLKKEKEEIENNFDTYLVQHDVSMNDLHCALTTNKEELLFKQTECAKVNEENSKLKEGNLMLIQIKDKITKENNDFITKIEHMEKENEESKNLLKNSNNQLSSLESKVYELVSEKENLVALELCSRQQLDGHKIKIVAQEQLQSRLEGEIVESNQAKETLIQENDKLSKQCEQHAHLKNEVLSLLKMKETSLEKYNTLSKELMMLKSEKESLDERYITTLLEKDQILASHLSQQNEVQILNNNLFSFKEQVVNFTQRNNELEVELQNIKMAKIMQDQQTYTSTLFGTNEVATFCNMHEDYENQVNNEFNVENKEPNSILPHGTLISPNVESLKKQVEFLKQQHNETIKERDKLALSLKENLEAYNNIVFYQTEIETLKQKMSLSNQQYAQLSQERDNVLQENTTLQQNIIDLQAKISSLKVEGDIMNSSAESEVTKHEVSKEKFQKHQIVSLQKSVKVLKEQQINLTKENMEIAFENEVLMKERDSLFASISSLKSQHDTIDVHGLKKRNSTIVKASLERKFEELVQSVDALGQSEESYAFKLKLGDLGKTIISIIENFTLSTKEKEKSKIEISSLQKECQKLHMAFVSSEKDKETLKKKLLDSRSTFDRFVEEISRLQKEKGDVEMKLSHTIAEKENAHIQIADLQIHMNNQQRMQHLPISYTMEKVQSLEAHNRCLRMEKDVLEECLKKRSIEINESQLFKQHMPSMTNFNCINQQPPSQHHLHTSSQLYGSGSNVLGRPPTSFLPILHQQWPM